ncbi:MAG: MBL fold metallo-hydrolase [Acidimicrobiia bacterium]|nr:MBL fold metallo-hydrolase [Acidimicrobiia bacterium]
MERVTKLADDLYQIDALMFDDTERLACYLFDGPERVLIECGPSVTLHHLTEVLDAAGVDDIATIAVTHIHLDHAGGVGDLAARYPNATIGVHAAGARHLVSPQRLWDSATRVYGEEGMATMWGPMMPVPEDRLVILDESSQIDLGGGRSLEVMDTPGHAKHHVVFFDDVSGGMFVGDSVGIAFPHGHIVQPVTPPPDLDPPLVIAQLQRMAARGPEFLGFAHFGRHDDPQLALQEAEVRIEEWVGFVRSLDADRTTAADRLREKVLGGYRADGVSEEVIAVYDKNTFWPMMPAGIFRWLDQHS